MLIEILTYAIQFAIQMAFLLLALWMMIKIQKLNYKFLWLLGSAALTIGLEMVLDRFVGVYFSTPLVCAVLLFGIAKTTGTSRVYDTDVVFTVFVAFALTFCMNLFLLGSIMGSLRPSAGDDVIQVAARELKDGPATTPPAIPVERTNATVKDTTHHETVGEKVGPTNSTKTAAASGSQKKSASKKSAAQSKEPPSPVEIAKSFVLKGVVRSSGKSLATIHTGTKAYMIGIGETLSMQGTKGRAEARCDEVREDSVILNVAGEQVQLYLQ